MVDTPEHQLGCLAAKVAGYTEPMSRSRRETFKHKAGDAPDKTVDEARREARDAELAERYDPASRPERDPEAELVAQRRRQAKERDDARKLLQDQTDYLDRMAEAQGRPAKRSEEEADDSDDKPTAHTAGPL